MHKELAMQDNIISDLYSKYSEWLEMAGDDRDLLFIKILAFELEKSNNENEYLKKIAYKR